MLILTDKSKFIILHRHLGLRQITNIFRSLLRDSLHFLWYPAKGPFHEFIFISFHGVCEVFTLYPIAPSSGSWFVPRGVLTPQTKENNISNLNITHETERITSKHFVISKHVKCFWLSEWWREKNCFVGIKSFIKLFLRLERASERKSIKPHK